MENGSKGKSILKIAALRLPILLKLREGEMSIDELVGKSDRRNNVKRINELEKVGLITSINKDTSNKKVKLYSLTQLSNDLLIVIKIDDKKTKLPAADKRLIGSYIKEMIRIENDKKKSSIIDELVYLSGRHTIEIDNSNLNILGEILYEEKDATIARSLLQLINNIIINKPDEREKFKEIFGHKFKKILGGETPFAVKHDDIQRKTIRFLQIIYHSDSIYDEIWATYVESLKNKGLEVSTPLREMLKEFYPEKRDYMRKKLIDLYDDKVCLSEKIDVELGQLR